MCDRDLRRQRRPRQRKLIPAIYEMAREKLLDENTYVVGYSRSPMTRRAVPQGLPRGGRRSIRAASRSTKRSWKKLEPNLLHAGGLRLERRPRAARRDAGNELDEKFGNEGNRLFYLSTPPETFDDIISCLGERRIAENGKDRTRRSGSASSSRNRSATTCQTHSALNKLLHKYFDEEPGLPHRPLSSARRRCRT